jgi:aspartate ammonia-lyase
MAYDQALTSACAAGSLELNPFLPLVAECLLRSLDLLRASCRMLARHCVAGLEADADRCRRAVEGATATATALVPHLGYAGALAAARSARAEGRTIREVVIARGWMSGEAYDEATSPEAVTRLGSVGPPPVPPGGDPPGAGASGAPVAQTPGAGEADRTAGDRRSDPGRATEAGPPEGHTR